MARPKTTLELPLDLDLRHLGTEALRQLYRCPGRRGFNVIAMYRSALYHLYRRVEAGLEPRPRRNLRGLYYAWGRPLIVAADQPADNAYRRFLEALADLVNEGRLQYADLGITDELWENRRIGTTHPGVIVFTEKTGQIRLLRAIHDRLEVTIQAYSGSPSAVTSTYLATHVREALGHAPPTAVLAVVDVDPFGWQIAHSVAAQLRHAGLGVPDPTLIVEPTHFTRPELEAHSYELRLPKSKQPIAQRWLEETGGLGGQLRGVALDALPRERLARLILDAVRAVL